MGHKCSIPVHETVPCPTGSIPYSTYFCSGPAATEYNCSGLDLSVCPEIPNMTAIPKFKSKEFKDGKAEVDCYYKYNPATITQDTINTYVSLYGVTEDLKKILPSFCTVSDHYKTSICQKYVPSSAPPVEITTPSAPTTSSAPPTTTTSSAPPTPPTTTTSSAPPHSSSNVGMIVGIIVGLLVLIAAIIIGIIIYRKKHKEKLKKKEVKI